MSNKQNLSLIICQFGIYDSSIRSKTEIEGIYNYTHSILEQASKIQDLTNIVLCGGYTQINYMSEAESNVTLYADFKKNNPNINKLLETVSQDFVENIVFGYLSVRKYNPRKLIIATDSVRSLKSEIITKTMFNNINIDFEFIHAERSDIHPHSNIDYQIHESLPTILASEKFQILKKIINLS